MTNDPFSPLADPYPPSPSRPTPASTTKWGLSRRRLGATLLLAAAIDKLIGCVPRRLACEPKVEDRSSCRHRFCRYYRSS